MMVVKKINNNVAICRDGNQRELIAFGKGIGFPEIPYELTDLHKIDRTFYNVSDQYIPMLRDIPPRVVQFTAAQIQAVQDELPYELSSNLVLTLADHISFIIERVKRNIYVQMPSVYEMELSYPKEIAVSRKLVSAIQKEFKVTLPKGEVQGIALHFINAPDRMLEEAPPNIEAEYEEILEQITCIIEGEMDIKVRRDTFNYARFATHVQYLLKRLFQEKHIDSSNLQMYSSMREEYGEAAACVDRISDYFRSDYRVELTEEEKLYLIMHVNRVCSAETI